MVSRGKRNVIIAGIVAFSLVLVAAIGTTAFFLIRKQHRSDDVAAAAQVAAAYTKKVSAYRSAVQSALNPRQLDDAARVKVAFDAAIAKTPTLGDAPAWGKEHSKTYLAAVRTQKTLKKPYDAVSEVLDEAIVGQPFVKAANTALDVKIDQFISERSLPDGGPIRTKLIPGFTKVLATFNKVPVPEGQESTADQVRDALKAMLKDAGRGADDLDSGRSTYISAASEYVTASTAVNTYERSLQSRLEAAVKKVTAAVSGQSTESAT
ncbi:hypothetical protein [Aeromicrobium ginsengisoli]|uniref:Uncharacterized protein n=1 Tax=Aeromicrobium ginsengisoli TaxID=363867 RepID=A0A5M4FGU5_9ACTN|nr:hypothetical protein [Aeromicrobium ginsengisoli]KAA1398003.1 hypothetical protein ESP70_011775 [Aeromicrobium ginsengisoli]